MEIKFKEDYNMLKIKNKILETRIELELKAKNLGDTLIKPFRNQIAAAGQGSDDMVDTGVTFGVRTAVVGIVVLITLLGYSFYTWGLPLVEKALTDIKTVK
ncbi:hypothetical protein D3C81_1231000 [compost metagenome]